jgi:dipeptidyl aminopeptidase/acylaminoacyl peptidase
MAENKATASLWLLSAGAGRPRLLTTSGEKDGQPAWSPDGRSIAFVAKREWHGKKDEEPQIYLIAPDGGEARRLTRLATGVAAIKWFPNARRIAFISWVWPDLRGETAQARRLKSRKEDKVKAHCIEHATYRFWDRWLADGRVPHLFSADLRGGCVDLFEGTPYELVRTDPDQHSYDISPDGRFVAFAYDPAPEKQLDDEFDIVELDLKTRRFRNLTPGRPHRDYRQPRYAPDGKRIACLSSNVRASPVAPNEITLVDRASGAIAVVSRRWDRNIEAPLRWTRDGSALLCLAQDRARQHLFRFPLKTTSPELVVRGGMVTEFDLAGDAVAFIRDDMHNPPGVYVKIGDGTERKAEAFNDALLRRFRLGPSEEVIHRGWGGEKVQTWLVFPPRFDPRKRYPLLHSIHGGPHAIAADSWHFRWNNHVFAAQGYIVACVNYHGSSSFGQEFIESIRHEFGKRELADIEAATALLAKRRYIDARRVFAAGGSYGGYMVAWMNGHVPAGRYRAYICHAGCFDWVSMFADDSYPFFAKELGAWYWKDFARIEAQNPRAAVKRMATPTLVIHGALDYRVPDTQGLQYYNTLKAKKVPVRLLHFPDENHWILKPQNSRLWYREFFAWLRRFDAYR